MDQMTPKPQPPNSTNSTSSQEAPFVTVITAAFNASSTLKSCLASVETQDYPHVEHVIVDGGSTDGTIDILHAASRESVRWISEADRGIYDAWNKGLKTARGEWIAFLGADDQYEPGAISAYMTLARTNPNALYLSGLVRWVGPEGRPRIIGKPWQWSKFSRYMCTAHVGSMHHRKLYEQYGSYDDSLRIVADYEFLLRAGKSLPAAFLPMVTAEMQGGGASDSLAGIQETALVKLRRMDRSPTLIELDRIIATKCFLGRRLLMHYVDVLSR